MAEKMAGKKMNFYPSISVVIPTFNSAKVIDDCLERIRFQDYPQEKIEILVIDGNSEDNTRKIAEKYGCVVMDNPEVIHPKGRVIGIRAARGDLILCLDSDNMLVGRDWMKKMAEPFSDSEIVASEPLYYSAKENDSLVTRYCSLIGADDPIVVYLGFYERYSALTGKWTGVPRKEEDKGNYLKVRFKDPDNIPSLGANGFMVRKEALMRVKYDPFYHMDVVYRIIKEGRDRIAKVKVGVIHRHGDNLKKFVLKKKRRIARRSDKEVEMEYRYPVSIRKFLALAVKCFLVFPLFFDSLKANCRKKSIIWLYHPFITLFIFYLYVYSVIRSKFLSIAGNQYEKV